MIILLIFASILFFTWNFRFCVFAPPFRLAFRCLMCTRAYAQTSGKPARRFRALKKDFSQDEYISAYHCAASYFSWGSKPERIKFLAAVFYFALYLQAFSGIICDIMVHACRRIFIWALLSLTDFPFSVGTFIVRKELSIQRHLFSASYY